MSDYWLNSTSVSVDVFVGDAGGLAVTGLVASTFPTVKYSAGAGSDTTGTLADLSLVTSAWAATSTWGIKERGEGVYRLDLPNTVFATAGVKTVRGYATGKNLICPAITVSTLTATQAGYLDTAISSRASATSMTTLLGRVSAIRAAAWDYLDAFISSRQPRADLYRRKPSAAGTAPSAHKDSKRGPLLREFLFNVWDPSSRSQLIGPQGLGRAIVPQLMEEGGTQAVRVLYPTTPSGRPLSPAAKAAFRRRVLAGAVQRATPQVSYRIATYPARPYMAPAFAKLLPRLPKFFEGSFRKVA